MEKQRACAVLTAIVALLGLAAVARADAPGPSVAPDAPQPTHARKKKRAAKPKAPAVSLACKSDDDCAFTGYADGECCPMLCPQRAVAKKSAEAIEKFAAACKKPEGGCPVPECAPPRIVTTPACISGKCVARAAPGPTRE